MREFRDSPRAMRAVSIGWILIGLFGLDCAAVKAADWPRFRGPGADGISNETDWKKRGPYAVAWEAEVGMGHSSFVVSEGRAIVTGNHNGNTDTVYCFDAVSGKTLWSYSYPHPLDDLYYTGGTTSTPTFEGPVAYHVARRGQLFCFDVASGKVLWKRHLNEELEIDVPKWGFSGSPVVDGERLLLNAGDAGLALDKRTGDLIWKSDNGEASYSTPSLFEHGGRKYAFFSNNRGYVCADRVSGEEKWRVKWLTRYGVNAAMPILKDDRVLVSSGYGKGGMLLEFPNGDPSLEPQEVWRSRAFATKMNTALFIKGRLYGIHGDEGQHGTGLVCADWGSGEILWKDTSVGHGAVIAADGHLIALSEDGRLRIGPVSPLEFNPIVEQRVLDGKCWTVPTLADGRLYCRNHKGDVVVLDLQN